MNCQQVSNLIQLKLDDALPELPSRASAHLRECNRCRALQAELQSLQHLAHTLDAPQLPEREVHTLAARIMSQLQRRAKTRSQGVFGRHFAPIRWQTALTTATVLALLALAVWQFRPHEAPLVTDAALDEEIELLFEEHTLEMEINLFDANTLSSQVITTVALETK